MYSLPSVGAVLHTDIFNLDFFNEGFKRIRKKILHPRLSRICDKAQLHGKGI